MGQFLPGLGAFVVAFVTSLVIFAVWVASRKRIAAATVGRAQEEAKHLTQEAESKRQETVLAAKEESHDLMLHTEEQTRKSREELATLEKELAVKTNILSDQVSAAERVDKKLPFTRGARGRTREIGRQGI